MQSFLESGKGGPVFGPEVAAFHDTLSVYRQQDNPRFAFYGGLIVVVGTLIWGFGDLFNKLSYFQ